MSDDVAIACANKLDKVIYDLAAAEADIRQLYRLGGGGLSKLDLFAAHAMHGFIMRLDPTEVKIATRDPEYMRVLARSAFALAMCMDDASDDAGLKMEKVKAHKQRDKSE